MKLNLLLIVAITLVSTGCSGGGRCASGVFADVATGYVAAGESDRALEAAQAMRKSALQARVLSEIAASYVKAGQEDKATALFTQSLKIADKIDSPPDKAMLLEAIALNYQEAGLNNHAAATLSQALQVSNSIWGEEFVKDTVLERIAVRYAEIGKPEQAFQVLDSIWGDYPKARAKSRIALMYFAAGDKNRALQIAANIETASSKANALLQMVADTGNYEQPLAIAQEIEDPTLKSRILTKIAELYSTKQPEQSAKVLSQALQASQAIEETPGQVEQLSHISLAYADIDKPELAAKTLAEALQLVSNIDTADQQAEALVNIVSASAKAEQKEPGAAVLALALAVAQTIDNEQKKAETLAKLAIASTTLYSYNQVINLIQTIAYPEIQASALTEIVEKYQKAGQKEQATSALTQAIQTIQTLNNPQEKARQLGIIAVQLARFGDYQQAIAIAQRIDPIQGGLPKASALAKIAQLHVKDDQKENAIALLSSALTAAKATPCPMREP
jgi:tetratricopeptide (TPR) repeat protein